MARTSGAKIVSWGEPPAPEPTGWEAIQVELGKRPGDWANLGDFTHASARKTAREKFPETAGYETRVVAGKDGKSSLWVRFTNPPVDAVPADAPEAPADKPKTSRTATRGGVV